MIKAIKTIQNRQISLDASLNQVGKIQDFDESFYRTPNLSTYTEERPGIFCIQL
jgi:hypothetical protein